MHHLKFLGCTFLFIFFIHSGSGQNPSRFEISGTVTDASTGESLPGVIVFVKEIKSGVTTDESGKYSLKLLPGNYTFRISYVGYDSREIKVNPATLQVLDIKLTDNTLLEEVVVTSRAKDDNISSVTMGVEKLEIQEIRRVPALMGEVDVLKVIQLLPGVQSTSEGGSGFSVRGGSADQNLILLDNTPVYNPSHMFGFFSVFNNDVISGVELYKGDIPVKQGGRLSSLLDVTTISNVPKKVTGTGGIGTISSRLMLQGPIGEKTTWVIAGRRTYADLFLKLSSDEALRKSTLYFYDLNGKLTHRISGNDKIELNVYNGNDVFGSEPGDFNYGNSAASLTWSHTFSEKLFSKYSFNLTDYKYGLKSKLEGSEAEWKSRITDYMLRADFVQPIGPAFNLTYGLSGILHQFKPAKITTPQYPSYEVPGNRALESGIYLSNEQKISEKVSLKYGLRWSVFQNIGSSTVYRYDDQYQAFDTINYRSGEIYQTYNAFEPRAGMVYKISNYISVKANYAHNAQFIQLANNSAAGSPLDIWFSASPNVKPQQADIFSVGYFQNLKENAFETSVEFYYKDLRNVIDFADHAQLLLNDQLEGEIRTGTGKAYGAEFMVKKNTGKLTGFVNYTLSRSERTIPEINNGKSYLAPFDKTHGVNVVLNYRLSNSWDVSATWIYATGNPTTYPTGRFEIDGEYFPIYSGRNEYRKPDYHRLDLSANYAPKALSTTKLKGEFNFSLYNAYNKKNPWTIVYDQDDVTGTPYSEMLYLFGIVPSITFNFKF